MEAEEVEVDSEVVAEEIEVVAGETEADVVGSEVAVAVGHSMTEAIIRSSHTKAVTAISLATKISTVEVEAEVVFVEMIVVEAVVIDLEAIVITKSVIVNHFSTKTNQKDREKIKAATNNTPTSSEMTNSHRNDKAMTIKEVKISFKNVHRSTKARMMHRVLNGIIKRNLSVPMVMLTPSLTLFKIKKSLQSVIRMMF